MTERIDRIAPAEAITIERQLPSQADVVIVGAGLSGRALAAALGPEINYLLIDSKLEKEHKEAMYLVTTSTARKWDIDVADRAKRNIITGTIFYDETGNVKGTIKTTGNTGEGFAVTPQTFMERHLEISPEKVFHETTFKEVTDARHFDGVTLKTNKGDIDAKIVIDATGWEGRAMHEYYGDEAYMMVAIYGGNYRTDGFDPEKISMIRGLPNNNTNWVMPISPNGAEIVAAQTIPSTQSDSWRNNHSEEKFREMVAMYERLGVNIQDEKTGIQMGFRIQPAKNKFYKGRVIPFGESGGLNSSKTGQLIDVIPGYAQRLADLLREAQEKNSWESVGEKFYKAFIQNPPYSYLVHSILRENTTSRLRFGESKTDVAIACLAMELPENRFWELLESGGIGIQEIALIVKNHPLLAGQIVLESIPSLASILRSNPDLYLQFIYNLRRKI